MPPKVSLVGQKFGKLDVTREAGRSAGGSVTWFCKCACGREATVRSDSLRQGLTKSCGCLKGYATKSRFTRHGLSESREYKTWENMLQRCTNPKNDMFEYYGGRGISVCPQWRDFQTFYADMGARPMGTSIDRIDNDGDYEPGNCRWATRAEQSMNRSNTIGKVRTESN